MIVSWFDQTLISNNAAAATTSIEIVPVILNYRHIQQTAQEKIVETNRTKRMFTTKETILRRNFEKLLLISNELEFVQTSSIKQAAIAFQ